MTDTQAIQPPTNQQSANKLDRHKRPLFIRIILAFLIIENCLIAITIIVLLVANYTLKLNKNQPKTVNFYNVCKSTDANHYRELLDKYYKDGGKENMKNLQKFVQEIKKRQNSQNDATCQYIVTIDSATNNDEVALEKNLQKLINMNKQGSRPDIDNKLNDIINGIKEDLARIKEMKKIMDKDYKDQ